MNIINRTTEFFRPSSAIPLALPEAAKALEEAWQRRRQELGNWQPSNGWLIEPAASVRRVTSSR
jgi:hypothetical protein